MERDHKSMNQEIRNFEKSKEDGFFGAIIGGRSEEQKQIDNKEIAKYRKRKEKEFDEKFRGEEQLIEAQLEDIVGRNPIFNPYDLKKMPDDYVQFVFNVIIPKIKIIVLDEDSEVGNERLLTRLTLDGVKTTAKIGQDFQDIDVGIGALNIKDYVTKSEKYKYLVENIFSGDKDSDYALSLIFQNHPKFDGGSMRIEAKTNSTLCIYANMKLIAELQEFADFGEKPEDQIDISYYADRAKIAAIEYMNVGVDLFESGNKNNDNDLDDQLRVSDSNAPKIKNLFSSIFVDLDIEAPTIFIPDGNMIVVIDLGYI